MRGMNAKRSTASTIRSVIWLVGMVILWRTGSFWPGILILAAVSMLAELAFKLVWGVVLDKKEDELPETLEPLNPDEAESVNNRYQRIAPEDLQPDPIPPAPGADKRNALLPALCPSCGAPLEAGKVAWLSDTKALHQIALNNAQYALQ